MNFLLKTLKTIQNNSKKNGTFHHSDETSSQKQKHSLHSGRPQDQENRHPEQDAVLRSVAFF